MKHLLILGAIAAFLLAATLAAADISGKWTGQVPRRSGEPAEYTFTFKVEGDRLTGTVTTPQGESPIVDGKVSGDTITFKVEDSPRGASDYKGNIAADAIQFTRTGRGGQARPFTAKRAK
jgi:hypothetical protein